MKALKTSTKSLTKNLEQNSISTSLEALRPNFIEYTRMMDALKYYRELTEKGGWQTIPAGPTIRIGHNDARVELIKKRLFATAELKEITTLEHTTYDEEELIEAVKSFQKSHNLKPDGLIGKKTIHALNVPASKIVEKIILNLERFRWLTPNLDKVPGYISINIPAFKMQLYEEGHERINMKVIVGRKDRPTPVTHSKLSYAVLNPSWTAPQTIIKEDSPYSKYIQSIDNIRFEKIRKYCENLSKENEADEMQKQLAEKGKMYKALIYSSLEVFIEKLNGETITLCDWGCSQGIASMLVLDYIKEKQLDIKVSDVILIDDDTKALNRAIAQVEALAQDTMKFTAIKSDDNNISDTIKSNKNNIVLNIFANDKITISFWTIDHDDDVFDKNYFLCVSNENKEFVDEVYETINIFMDVQDMSKRDGKIGKFEKFERIFVIDNNEILF